MEKSYTYASAEDLESGYQNFYVENEVAGSLSEIRGASDVRAGVYRLERGEFPEGVEIDYEFESDEYMWIIEGRLEISTPDGNKMVLNPGDTCFFPKGDTCRCTFTGPFRKYSVEVGLIRSS
ncbi:DUF861 domain-containing protein [Rhodococcus sp. 05-339-2]|uniref:cupin domain-containing protein n=1 Tax=Rhodococcoides fascians TaxID=1828 RepID=UPI00068B643B|nr:MULTISPECIES: cupin domain-containing protein [Rhodococcus]OZD81382.1 DUF861 domain-containing protein [Rhodococcus sp. 05-339-2]